MKRIIIILLLVFGIHITIVSQSKASAPDFGMINKTLKASPEQKQELAKLVNLYKRQAKHYCDVCQLGTETRYTHRTNTEYQHLVRTAQQKLDGTIRSIKTLYDRMGMKHSDIAQEEKKLRAVFYYWF